ncbi:hypothetical protein AX768_02480 [Burkholderia sp. PAMC 28687]|uniref:flagellar biosynthetic protein FliO n=1 Tax=Burkholderia sp. PAMC 28687 TaxID=1795874 RepID=UPI0007806BC4|nr:flagellar biosynthetic protein FliO [Burkholderia sp. PAMC 28687]AMM13144.1 hypothetical protein AX768_02480 [Burkholderia sp. PAMC 28687]
MNGTTYASSLQDASQGVSTPAATLTPSFVSSGLAGVDFFHTVIALVFCLALGVVAILIIRRTQGIASTRAALTGSHRIKVLDNTRLNTRITLHLVECAGRVVLLASDASGIKLLDANDSREQEPHA